MITVGSICTGYGGLELALGMAGVEHRLAWCSEIDPLASAVIAHHWPDAPNLGDINYAEPEPVDLITAGFPCQDISVAGQQAGIHGEQSGLWWRIRDIVGDVRPRWVLLENVAAIATNGGPAVVGSLTALGYDCRWVTVRAADMGACHGRARWFCVAADTNRASRPQQITIAGRSRPAVAAPNNASVADTDGGGLEAIRWRPDDIKHHPDRCDGEETYGPYALAVGRWEQRIGRRAPAPTADDRLNPRFVEWMMGLPDGWVTDVDGSRAAQLRVLGNGVVPQQAAHALTLIAPPPRL